MAQYNMIKEVKEIAKLKGIENLKAVAEELKVDYRDEERIIACNRREQNAVIGKLEELKREIKQEEVKTKRFSGYRWVLENSKWVVAGNFSGKQIGDKVTVVKANGSESVKEIVNFTEAGNAIVA